uniref:Uncharacterized protein n=1 Tax=Arundo donax TaxID=35708 RepID=A0A0A8Z8L6_ARUDO
MMLSTRRNRRGASSSWSASSSSLALVPGGDANSMFWCGAELDVADAGSLAVGVAAGVSTASGGDDADGGGVAEPDVEASAGAHVVNVLVVVLTAGSRGSDSSMTKPPGSTSCSLDHAHCAASSKITSRLMWTCRVVGS